MKIKDQEMYHAIWLKYLPVIAMKLKQVVRNGAPAHIGMYQFEFHTAGKQRNVGHQFNLELRQGRVVNDISKYPAAKELSAVMKDDAVVGSILHSGHFLFSLDGNFALTIQNK
jgi:hypothetical protein